MRSALEIFIVMFSEYLPRYLKVICGHDDLSCNHHLVTLSNSHLNSKSGHNYQRLVLTMYMQPLMGFPVIIKSFSILI